MSLVWRAAAWVALFVLAGCSTPPPPAGDVLVGRISVQVEADGTQAARQLSAGFELRGSPTRGELDLTSPLGTVVARARWEPGQAELTSPEGSTRFANLTELSTRTFGEPLPLAALFDWLRGRPWGDAPSQPTPGSVGFEQLGWRINSSQSASGLVQAERLAAPVVRLRARLELP